MFIQAYSEELSDKQISLLVNSLESGEIIILPTDTLYAFVCDINSRKACETLARLKGKALEKSNFSLLCRNLSQACNYIKPLSNTQFSFIKGLKTGGFTFVLRASNFTPKIFQSKKKTIGIRIAENRICSDILERMGRPLLVSSVPHTEEMDFEDFSCAEIVEELYKKDISHIVGGEFCKNIPSTVVDMTGDECIIVREGLGVVE